jgi:hypothetical protein
VEWTEPTVGSYQVNYAAIDKYLPFYAETCDSTISTAPLRTSTARNTTSTKPLSASSSTRRRRPASRKDSLTWAA